MMEDFVCLPSIAGENTGNISSETGNSCRKLFLRTLLRFFKISAKSKIGVKYLFFIEFSSKSQKISRDLNFPLILRPDVENFVAVSPNLVLSYNSPRKQ